VSARGYLSRARLDRIRERRRSGRKAGARAYDAMIAAVALANGLPLYTCNPDDFTGIDGLVVVAVAHPASVPPAG